VGPVHLRNLHGSAGPIHRREQRWELTAVIPQDYRYRFWTGGTEGAVTAEFALYAAFIDIMRCGIVEGWWSVLLQFAGVPLIGDGSVQEGRLMSKLISTFINEGGLVQFPTGVSRLLVGIRATVAVSRKR
jgi:hypothetical protein